MTLPTVTERVEFIGGQPVRIEAGFVYPTDDLPDLAVMLAGVAARLRTEAARIHREAEIIRAMLKMEAGQS